MAARARRWRRRATTACRLGRAHGGEAAAAAAALAVWGIRHGSCRCPLRQRRRHRPWPISRPPPTCASGAWRRRTRRKGRPRRRPSMGRGRAAATPAVVVAAVVAIRGYRPRDPPGALHRCRPGPCAAGTAAQQRWSRCVLVCACVRGASMDSSRYTFFDPFFHLPTNLTLSAATFNQPQPQKVPLSASFPTKGDDLAGQPSTTAALRAASLASGLPASTCKILVVGNAKCGKTSVIRRFVQGSFENVRLSVFFLYIHVRTRRRRRIS